MNAVKIILGTIAILLALLGFISWRFEFSLPFFEFWVYLIVGGVVGLAIFFGRAIGKILMKFSVLPFAYALVIYIFDRSTAWKDISDPVLTGVASLVGGAILYLIGAGEKETEKISPEVQSQ